MLCCSHKCTSMRLLLTEATTCSNWRMQASDHMPATWSTSECHPLLRGILTIQQKNKRNLVRAAYYSPPWKNMAIFLAETDHKWIKLQSLPRCVVKLLTWVWNYIFMAALCNRGTIIFLPCSFFLLLSFFYLLLLFFPRLISAAVDRMSAILLHMAWP